MTDVIAVSVCVDTGSALLLQCLLIAWSFACTVQVGTNSSCQQYLQASWSVCSLPLGSGTGPVRVQLPRPTAIANITASPVSIASAGNAASQVPMGLPTASKLSVMVAFSDNTVRDFSRDARTTFAVTTGSSTCSVVAGGWRD
jgi:hypothetical protein